jgi:hypothetical protein
LAKPLFQRPAGPPLPVFDNRRMVALILPDPALDLGPDRLWMQPPALLILKARQLGRWRGRNRFARLFRKSRHRCSEQYRYLSPHENEKRPLLATDERTLSGAA